MNGNVPLNAGDADEPALAPLSGDDAQVVVDPQAAQPATVNAHVHVLSATLLAVGGTPLVSQSVLIIDPQTGQPVGDPVTTDENGHLSAQIPDDRAYAIRLVDDDEDTTAPPEESAPFNPADADLSRLYLVLLDAGQKARAGVAYQLSGLSGPGTTYTGTTDGDGVIEILGCSPGAYTLHVENQDHPVHTLFDSDLSEDPDPYRVLTALA
jgi:hypothetical protein